MKTIISTRKMLLSILPTQKHPILRRFYRGIYSFASPSKVHMNGFEILFDPKGVADFFSSEYEPEETNIFNKIIKPEWVVLDGGANIGYHTLTFSRLAREVWAFEPALETFGYLQKNIAHNNVKNVRAINAALSEETGQSTLETSNEDGAPMGAGSYRIGNRGKLEIIKTFRADELNQSYDFIKLDIEGHELKALKGMKNILKKKPVLFVEFNPMALRWAGEDPTALLNFILSYGYDLYDIKTDVIPSLNNPFPLSLNPFVSRQLFHLTHIIC